MGAGCKPGAPGAPHCAPRRFRTPWSTGGSATVAKSEIAKRVDELKALEARVSVLRIELGVLREILERAPEAAPTEASPVREHHLASQQASEAERTASAVPNGHDTADQRSGARTAGRQLQDKWRVVLEDAVRRYPSPVSNEEVADIQRRHGIEPASKTNVRSHFWAGRQSGIYESVGRATVRATQKGADAIGIPLGSGQTTDASFRGTEEGPDDDDPSGPSSLFVGAA